MVKYDKFNVTSSSTQLLIFIRFVSTIMFYNWYNKDIIFQ